MESLEKSVRYWSPPSGPKVSLRYLTRRERPSKESGLEMRAALAAGSGPQSIPQTLSQGSDSKPQKKRISARLFRSGSKALSSPEKARTIDGTKRPATKKRKGRDEGNVSFPHHTSIEYEGVRQEAVTGLIDGDQWIGALKINLRL